MKLNKESLKTMWLLGGILEIFFLMKYFDKSKILKGIIFGNYNAIDIKEGLVFVVLFIITLVLLFIMSVFSCHHWFFFRFRIQYNSWKFFF